VHHQGLAFTRQRYVEAADGVRVRGGRLSDAAKNTHVVTSREWMTSGFTERKATTLPVADIATGSSSAACKVSVPFRRSSDTRCVSDLPLGPVAAVVWARVS
jgi:hypothetical protein